MNTQKRLWPILIVIVTALCISACAGPSVQVPVPAQLAEKVTAKDVLQTCAVLGDQDMAEIRGCYDSIYAFGLDFVGTLDLANTQQRIVGTINAYAAVLKGNPLDVVSANFNNGNVNVQSGGGSGGGISFEAGNGQVAFHSSIGNSPLGTGVIQLVQVMGNNNLVLASTNVTLNIQNFHSIKSNGLSGLNIGGLRR